MINKDGGGGGNFWILWGHSCYEGDIELIGGPPSPPTRENPGLSQGIVLEFYLNIYFKAVN